MSRPTAWRARIRVHAADQDAAERLVRVLAPEVAREVPKVRTSIARVGSATVELRFAATETGGLRAGLNTYLGWIRLVAAAERVADAADGAPAGEALI